MTNDGTVSDSSRVPPDVRVHVAQPCYQCTRSILRSLERTCCARSVISRECPRAKVLPYAAFGVARPQKRTALRGMKGKRLLERAIAERLDFAFETTLGGHTIGALLHAALAAGIDVRMWFVGLSSPELHMARVSIQGGSRRTRHSRSKNSGALRSESHQSD